MVNGHSKKKELIEQLHRTVNQDALVDAAVEHFAVQLAQQGMVGHYLRCYAPELIEHFNKPGRKGYFCTLGANIPCPPPQYNQPSDELARLVEEFYENLCHRKADSDTAGQDVDYPDSIQNTAIDLHAEEIVRITDDFNPHWLLPTGNPVELDVLDKKNLSVHSQIDRWAARAFPDSPQMKHQQNMINDMSKAVKGVSSDSAYTCGGSISMDGNAVPSDNEFSSQKSPLYIRFDLDNGTTEKAIFDGPNTDNTNFSVKRLLQQCGPASFGRGGEDVFDTSYRNAMKLDTERFSSNFHPHDHGILDRIAQTLLPLHLRLKSSDIVLNPGITVRAILYKLNVYSGPSGMFKPHVDTPRSANQFGSLVVSVPSYHVGGALRVMHGDKSVTYDWGSSSNIEWAAFFSDCEHEVQEVTSGHRVTLTYNLYWQEFSPLSEISISPADLGSMELHTTLSGILQSEDFMPQGGILGFYCQHAYPRYQKSDTLLKQFSSQQAADKELSRFLKGADMIVYHVLKALGLDPIARSIIREEEYADEEERYPHEVDSDFDNDDQFDIIEYTTAPVGIKQTSQGLHVSYSTLEAHKHIGIGKTFEQRYQNLLNQRRITSLDIVDQYREDYISSFFSQLQIVEGQYEDKKDLVYLLEEHTSWEQVQGIYWLNEPCESQPAISYTAYGNEANSACMYSSGAITVVVPPWSPTRGRLSDDHRQGEEQINSQQYSTLENESQFTQHDPSQIHDPNIDVSSFPQDMSFTDDSQGSELQPIEID